MIAKERGVCASELPNALNINELDAEMLKIYKEFHATIKNVSEALENRFMNKTIAYIRDAVNALYSVIDKIPENKHMFTSIFCDLIKLFAPIAPHICEEAWSMFNFKKLVSENSWPIYMNKLLEKQTINLPIQVNGKLRGTLEVDLLEDENIIFEKALKLTNVHNAIDGKQLKKKIFIKGKIVNFVV